MGTLASFPNCLAFYPRPTPKSEVTVADESASPAQSSLDGKPGGEALVPFPMNDEPSWQPRGSVRRRPTSKWNHVAAVQVDASEVVPFNVPSDIDAFNDRNEQRRKGRGRQLGLAGPSDLDSRRRRASCSSGSESSPVCRPTARSASVKYRVTRQSSDTMGIRYVRDELYAASVD
jgi:hypothetical protein